MPAATPQADDSHQQLLDTIDLASKPRPFRNPAWKPSARRNKNVKQIVSEASRKEASVLATQNNSGTTTPNPSSTVATGAVTPQPSSTSASNNSLQPGYSLAAQVLEKNLRAAQGNGNGDASPAASGVGAGMGMGAGGPAATYTNIESAPSLHPASQKHYCDITGLPAAYTDPKTRLRYVNKEVFDVVRTLPQGVAEKYLEARAAHVVLK